jgi:hypothetical protein
VVSTHTPPPTPGSASCYSTVPGSFFFLFMDFKLIAPDWKAFILPALVLLIYIIIIKQFYTLGALQDEYLCNATSIDSLQSVTDGRLGLDVERQRPYIYRAVNLANAWMPWPCGYFQTTSCRTYASEESIACLDNRKASSDQSLTDNLSSSSLGKPVSPLIIAMHGILFALEAFILSWIILVSVRYIRR